MPTPRKERMLADLTSRMQRASIAISAEYRGLTVTQLTELRRALRPANVDVKVVKNTVASMAARDAGHPDMAQIFRGPTAVAFGMGDPIAPVKLLTEYMRTRRVQLNILGGYLQGSVLDRAGVESLATMPSREQLIADFVGKMQSPLYGFAGLINAPITQFARLLNARADQLEGVA